MESASGSNALCETESIAVDSVMLRVHSGTVPAALATRTGVSTVDPLTPSMMVCIAQSSSLLQPEEEESETKEEPAVADCKHTRAQPRRGAWS